MCKMTATDVAFNVCAILRQMLPATEDLLGEWEAVCRGDSEGTEALAVDTAARLIGRVVAEMRSAMSSKLPGCPPDVAPVLAVLSALDTILAKYSTVGSRVVALMGMCDGPYAWLATHLARTSLEPSIPDDKVGIDGARLPLQVVLRCVGPEKISPLVLLEMVGSDLLAAISTITATFRFQKSAEGMSSLPLGSLTVLARCLQGLPSSNVFVERLRWAGVQDTEAMDIATLNAYQLSHWQDVTLAVIQELAIPVAASVGESSEERLAIAAGVLSMIRFLVSSPSLASTGRLLGRHLAVHHVLFLHRMVSPLMRRLLSLAEPGKPNARANGRAAREHLRTIRWISHHSPELRPLIWPLCCEWFQRSFSQSPLACDLCATVLAAISVAGGVPDNASHILTSLSEEEKSEICAALIREASSGPRDNYIWERLTPFGLWDAAAFESTDAHGTHLEDDSDDFARQDNVVDEVLSDTTTEDEESIPELTGNHTLGPFDWPDMFTSPLTDAAPDKAMVLVRNIPAELRCSIDGRICRDPCAGPNGILFDRVTIESWLRQKQICPVTGAPLKISELRDDDYTRARTAAWLRASP